MKRTITILISLLLLSISAEAGVLKKFDYTQFNHLFPDSLHKKFRILSLDTDFINFYIHQSIGSIYDSNGKFIDLVNYGIYKSIFPGKPESNTIDMYDKDSLIRINLDSIKLIKYKNGWYNIKNSFINFSKNKHLKVPTIFVDTLHIKPVDNIPVDSIFTIYVEKIYISSNDEFFCTGRNNDYPNVGKCGIYKFVEGNWELITKPWERISDNKEEFLQIYYYVFSDNDEFFYVWNDAINKLNLNTMVDEELALFDSFSETGDEFIKYFPYKDIKYM